MAKQIIEGGMQSEPKIVEYFGTVAKIGLINMAGSVVMEPEFSGMAPQGVSIHTSRLHLPTSDLAGLHAMMDGEGVERSTRQLAASPLNAIVFGGTSATFLGPRYDEGIIARMSRVSDGIPVTTTTTAAVRGLRALKARRISFVAPYIEEVLRKADHYFTGAGFEVANTTGLGLLTEHAMAEVSLKDVYDFVRGATDPSADTVFISCTNFRTVGAIEALETALQRPVVSAIQASFWDCLNLAGVAPETVTGFGSLFKTRPAPGN